MIIREDEASTKECRFFGPVISMGQQRIPRCVGLNCMGWRVATLPIAATHSTVNGKRITEAQPGTGYCGYAGKP